MSIELHASESVIFPNILRHLIATSSFQSWQSACCGKDSAKSFVSNSFNCNNWDVKVRHVSLN